MVITLVLVFLLLSCLFFFSFFKRKKKSLLLQDFNESLRAKHSYKYIDYRRLIEDQKKSKDCMGETLDGLINLNYKSLYLVHGTFVGDDPFNLYELVKNSFPNISTKKLKLFKRFAKETTDIFCSDFGNFTSEHIQYLNSFAKDDLLVSNFTWSSGNNHYARVKASIDLAKCMRTSVVKKENIVLIGHSHAGQLFALISQMMVNKVFRHFIEDLFDENLLFIEDFINVNLIYITLGTPARYRWQLCSRHKLLHFINHRRPTPFGGSIKSSFMTRSGDYIQQWAVNGSDVLPLDLKAREACLRLNQFLGDGVDRKVLRDNIEKKQRFHHVGFHYLCDFGDKALYPNLFLTGLGHGTYTKINYLPLYLSYAFKHLS